MRDKSVHKLVLTALMTALVMLATMVIVIPVPGTGGFVNVGDTMIFVTAILLGPQAAMLAGGIGSSLADLLLGYANWAPYTLFIKGLEGGVAGLLAYDMFSGGRTRWVRGLLGLVAGALLMVGGYFFAAGAMYGTPAAVAGLPGDLFQGGVSVFLSLPLALTVRRILTGNRKE